MMLHKGRFAATIFSATQRYNIVFTLFPMAAIVSLQAVSYTHLTLPTNREV